MDFVVVADFADFIGAVTPFDFEGFVLFFLMIMNSNDRDFFVEWHKTPFRICFGYLLDYRVCFGFCQETHPYPIVDR